MATVNTNRTIHEVLGKEIQSAGLVDGNAIRNQLGVALAAKQFEQAAQIMGKSLADMEQLRVRLVEEFGEPGATPTDAIELLVAERVKVALANRFRVELKGPVTKNFMTVDERRDFLTKAFGEIAKGMGIDRFLETPVERLDQFAVMSVVKNHDTCGLLRSLMNSFMIAYSSPETVEAAFQALLQLEALRAKVADDRGQVSSNARLVSAAKMLDAQLAQRLVHHSVSNPLYCVLVGADRLFVMSPKRITELPVEIEGIPIEHIQSELKATAH